MNPNFSNESGYQKIKPASIEKLREYADRFSPWDIKGLPVDLLAYAAQFNLPGIIIPEGEVPLPQVLYATRGSRRMMPVEEVFFHQSRINEFRRSVARASSKLNGTH